MIAATIQRDTFARQSLKRQTVDNRAPGLLWCSSCGEMPRRLYRYAWRADRSSRRATFDTRRQFCNLSCHTAHNG